MLNIITLTPSVNDDGSIDHSATHVMRTRNSRDLDGYFVAGSTVLMRSRFERFGYRVVWHWPETGCYIMELVR